MEQFGADILSMLKADGIVFETKSRFDDFVNRFIDTQVANKVTGLQPNTRKTIIKSIRRLIKESVNEGESIDEAAKRLQGLAEDAAESGTTDDPISEEIRSTYSKFSKGRTQTIARTEIHNASMEGSRSAAKSLQVPNLEKVWVSSDDDRTRDGDPESTNHVVMNGETVGIDEKFSVPSKDGPDQMDGPGDTSAPADQVVNCRCTQVYQGGRNA